MKENFFGFPRPEGKYAENRLNTRRDDRCDESKLWEDAKLRGKIGINQANKIINMIDDYKSRN